MRNLKILVILAVLPSLAFACLCSDSVIQSFENVRINIQKSLQNHQNELDNLSEKLEKSTQILKNQNEQIKIANELDKKMSEKTANVIFLLRQKIELER